MGPVHLYLAAWVAGGVLLGTSMLLEERQRGSAEDALPEPGETQYAGASPKGSDGVGSNPSSEQVALGPAQHTRGHLARSARLLPLGLIGFGLSGLMAKGLDLDLWPWTFLCALSVGCCLIAAGYGLSRSRLL